MSKSQLAVAPYAFQSIDTSLANMDKTLTLYLIGDDFHNNKSKGFQRWLIYNFNLWVRGGSLIDKKTGLIYGGRDGACRAFVAIIKYLLNMQPNAIPTIIPAKLQYHYGRNETMMLIDCLEYMQEHLRRSIAQLSNDPRSNYKSPNPHVPYVPHAVRTDNWRANGPQPSEVAHDLKQRSNAFRAEMAEKTRRSMMRKVTRTRGRVGDGAGALFLMSWDCNPSIEFCP
jgi:hypothetical protein